MLAAGFLLALGRPALADEQRWRALERETHGNLQRMFEVIEREPALPHRGLTRSAADLTAILSRTGRFRELGLTDQEGSALVTALYRKLGVQPFGAPEVPEPAQRTAAAAPFTYRAGAEFEPLSHILVRWPFDWPSLTDEYASLVKLFAEGGVTVLIWVDTAKQQEAAAQILAGAGVPPSRIEWRVENTDSIWIRDYGPQFLYGVDNSARALADFRYYRYRPNDDDTPLFVAGALGLPVIDRQTSEPVCTEGGNLMHDGLGAVIYSRRTYAKNRDPEHVVDNRILSAFQATRGIVLQDPALDSTGHVDMFIKVLDESTVLVGQYTPDQPDYAVLEQAAALLAQARNGSGKRWRVERIPQPAVYYTRFALPVVRTYTNAQMVNGVVVVPVYGVPEDEAALATYRRLLPGRGIVGLNANDIIEAGGAWHCVAMEIRAPR